MMYSFLFFFAVLLFAFLAWRDFRLALRFFLAFFPLYLLRLSIGPLPTTLLEAFLLILLTIWLIRFRPSFHSLKEDPFFLAGLFLLAAATLSAALSPQTLPALGAWKAYFLEPLVFYVLLRDSLYAKRLSPHDIFLSLSASVIFLALFAIFQISTGLALPAEWFAERRATALFDYPNAVGLFIAPIVTALLILASAKTTFRPWYLFAAFAGLLAFLLSETEAAIIAVPAGLLLTLFISPLSKRFKAKVVGASAVLLGFFFLASTTVREKLLFLDSSGLVRRSQWKETFELLLDKPAFGAGLSGYKEALVPYHDFRFYEIFEYPHQIFLNIWSELGLLGIAAFFLLAFLTVKTVAEKKSTHQIWQFAAFGALATMTVHGLVDVPYFKNDLALLTFTMIAILSFRPKD